MIEANELQAVPVLKAGTYRHYKGKRYEVVGVALHTETHEAIVVYKPLYESVNEFWVRPYEMFIESVEVNGQIVPRFEYIGE